MPCNPGQVLNARYRIVKLLAQGGFGTVYRAWDLNLSRPCAIKENLDVSKEAQAQFNREAIILANLSHPNLARVTDYFLIEGQGQYLVMDFVEGQDLQQMVEERLGPLPEAQAVAWVVQVCEALAYLHSQTPPIIHRDIKPANIKINSQGKAILVDFGIAKVYDPNLKTTVGARAVTPGYSPPEQYGQGKTDHRSDIYALGATLYTLLTGQAPPDSVDIMTGSVPPPQPVASLNPAVSPATAAVVASAMNLNRTGRLASASELQTALLSGSGPAVSFIPSSQAATFVPSAGAAGSHISPARPASQPPPGQTPSQPPARISPAKPAYPPPPKPHRRNSWAVLGSLSLGAIGIVVLAIALMFAFNLVTP